MDDARTYSRDPLTRAAAWDRCYPGNLNIEMLVDDLASALRAAAERERDYREALEPFARSGELFPEPLGTVEFDQCIYMPAAGERYALAGEDLRLARSILSKHKTGTDE